MHMHVLRIYDVSTAIENVDRQQSLLPANEEEGGVAACPPECLRAHDCGAGHEARQGGARPRDGGKRAVCHGVACGIGAALGTNENLCIEHCDVGVTLED